MKRLVSAMLAVGLVLLCGWSLVLRLTASSGAVSQIAPWKEQSPLTVATPVNALGKLGPVVQSSSQGNEFLLAEYSVAAPLSNDRYAFGAVWGPARDLADARWLREHGFPSRAEYERYSAMRDEELEKAVAAGDALAMAFLAERLYPTSNLARANDLFAESAARGSLFALHLQADSMGRAAMTMDVETRRTLMGIAVRRLIVAAILGDQPAYERALGFGMSMRSPSRPLGEDLVVTNYAAALRDLHQLRLRRIALGLGDFPASLRFQ